MRTPDILKSAIQNTFRSRLRTTLTVITIFISTFTLPIRSAIGAGISSFIDAQLGSIGAVGVLSVTPTPKDQLGVGDGPAVYDPTTATAGGFAAGPPGFSGTLGAKVTLGATDAVGEQHEITATVAGVQNTSLLPLGASINEQLTDELVSIRATSLAVAGPVGYISAVAHIDPGASQQQIDTIKAALAAEGFRALTTADQIGSFQTVISGIIGVLNAFAVIALIAAGFGIVNTLPARRAALQNPIDALRYE